MNGKLKFVSFYVNFQTFLKFEKAKKLYFNLNHNKIEKVIKK